MFLLTNTSSRFRERRLRRLPHLPRRKLQPHRLLQQHFLHQLRRWQVPLQRGNDLCLPRLGRGLHQLRRRQVRWSGSLGNLHRLRRWHLPFRRGIERRPPRLGLGLHRRVPRRHVLRSRFLVGRGLHRLPPGNVRHGGLCLHQLRRRHVLRSRNLHTFVPSPCPLFLSRPPSARLLLAQLHPQFVRPRGPPSTSHLNRLLKLGRRCLRCRLRREWWFCQQLLVPHVRR